MRTYNLQLTPLTPLDRHNEAGHRKGLLCAFTCEFTSLSRPFSQVPGKPRSLNTSLMCTQEMLPKKMRRGTEFWIRVNQSCRLMRLGMQRQTQVF